MLHHKLGKLWTDFQNSLTGIFQRKGSTSFRLIRYGTSRKLKFEHTGDIRRTCGKQEVMLSQKNHKTRVARSVVDSRASCSFIAVFTVYLRWSKRRSKSNPRTSGRPEYSTWCWPNPPGWSPVRIRNRL